MFTETISNSAAFLAGLLSFFSPCVLPLLPAYFSFITGLSLEELIEAKNTQIRQKIILATLAFVTGFSSIFILLGASASMMGGFIFQYQEIIRVAGGILIIILGVHLTGLIRIRILEFEKRIHLNKKPLHFLGTFIIGMAFGAGWSPCIGPLLGSVLIIAGSKETVGQGIVLLGFYSIGLALPFIIISFFINYLLTMMKKTSKILKYVNLAAGWLLIIIGLLLVTNSLHFLGFS